MEKEPVDDSSDDEWPNSPGRQDERSNSATQRLLPESHEEDVTSPEKEKVEETSKPEGEKKSRIPVALLHFLVWIVCLKCCLINADKKRRGYSHTRHGVIEHFFSLLRWHRYVLALLSRL